jgi:ribonucleoside-diphosphate reductase beta chain
MIGNIYSETYSQLIDTYIKGVKRKDYLCNALEIVPAVSRKGQWALTWINSKNFAERLIAFAAIEGMFFSGPFCSIFCLKKRDLTFYIELIAPRKSQLTARIMVKGKRLKAATLITSNLELIPV